MTLHLLAALIVCLPLPGLCAYIAAGLLLGWGWRETEGGGGEMWYGMRQWVREIRRK